MVIKRFTPVLFIFLIINVVAASNYYKVHDYSPADDGEFALLNPGWDSGQGFEHIDIGQVCSQDYCIKRFHAERVSGHHSNSDYEMESKVKFFVPPGVTRISYTTGHKITARRFGIALARHKNLPEEPDLDLWEMSWDEINSHDWDEAPGYLEYLDGNTKILSRAEDFSAFAYEPIEPYVRPGEAGWIYIEHLFTGCADTYGYDVDYSESIDKCPGVYYPEISIQEVQWVIQGRDAMEEYNKWADATDADPTAKYHTTNLNPMLFLIGDKDTLILD